MESKSSEPYASQMGSNASVSEIAPVSMNRSNGIASGRSAAPTAATGERIHGRGAPRSTQTSRPMRKNGATTNVFRSWIRLANTEANAATTSRSETDSAMAAAANAPSDGVPASRQSDAR